MVVAECSSPALPWGRRAEAASAGQDQKESTQPAPAADAATSRLLDQGPHSIEELARFTALRQGSRVQVSSLARLVHWLLAAFLKAVLRASCKVLSSAYLHRSSGPWMVQMGLTQK